MSYAPFRLSHREIYIYINKSFIPFDTSTQMSLNVTGSACMLCGKPVDLTLIDGTHRTIMLDTSTDNSHELDTPLSRMTLLTDMLKVCPATTTLGEIVSNGNYHTSSTQNRWFRAMPQNNTLGWLIHTEKILHPGTDEERQHKQENWDFMMTRCGANMPENPMH